MITAVRQILRAGACLAFLALAACHPPQLADSAPGSEAVMPGAYPPPLPAQEWPTSETLLLGGPPDAPQPAAPSPPAPQYTQPPAMQPPPLPEAALAAIDAPAPAPIPREEPHPAPTPAPAPAPEPAQEPAPAPAPETAPAAPTRPKALAGAAKPAPQAAAAPARPAPEGVEPKSTLGEALATDLARAKLSLPDTLSRDEAGVATLDLPADFIDRLREEAAKLGLGPEAANADLRITLKGDGYVIKPAEPQIAPLKSGQSPRFSWTVADTDPAVNAPLSVEIATILKGRGKPQTVEIAALAAPPIETPKVKAPGAGLALLIPLLLIIAAIFFLGLWARDRRKDKARKEVKETPLEL